MNRDQEISEMVQLALRLGPNSYLGPWITSILPTLRQDMMSDVLPTVTIAETINNAHQRAAAILNVAQSDAANLGRAARLKMQEAERVLEDAKRERDHAQRERDSILTALAVAEREILRERQ